MPREKKTSSFKGAASSSAEADAVQAIGKQEAVNDRKNMPVMVAIGASEARFHDEADLH